MFNFIRNRRLRKLHESADPDERLKLAIKLGVFWDAHDLADSFTPDGMYRGPNYTKGPYEVHERVWSNEGIEINFSQHIRSHKENFFITRDLIYNRVCVTSEGELVFHLRAHIDSKLLWGVQRLRRDKVIARGDIHYGSWAEVIRTAAQTHREQRLDDPDDLDKMELLTNPLPSRAIGNNRLDLRHCFRL